MLFLHILFSSPTKKNLGNIHFLIRIHIFDRNVNILYQNLQLFMQFMCIVSSMAMEFCFPWNADPYCFWAVEAIDVPANYIQQQ